MLLGPSASTGAAASWRSQHCDNAVVLGADRSRLLCVVRVLSGAKLVQYVIIVGRVHGSSGQLQRFGAA
jgi:hypothetical protein